MSAQWVLKSEEIRPLGACVYVPGGSGWETGRICFASLARAVPVSFHRLALCAAERERERQKEEHVSE